MFINFGIGGYIEDTERKKYQCQFETTCLLDLLLVSVNFCERRYFCGGLESVVIALGLRRDIERWIVKTSVNSNLSVALEN